MPPKQSGGPLELEGRGHPLSSAHLGQAEAGLHADPVEALLCLQDVCQRHPGGRRGELLQRGDGLLLGGAEGGRESV